MNVPLELSFRRIEKSADLESLIREKVEKLEQMCDYLSSCRVSVDRIQHTPSRGSPYRVRVDLTVPPNHEVVATREPGEGEADDVLASIIREVFDAAQRQLKELVQRQRGKLKSHPQQEVMAIVSRLYPEKGFGFLRTNDGREIYFHRNSVVNEEFDDLSVGTGVNFQEEPGEQGPQATSVKVIGRTTR
jgi:cold shock CspA family protein/ribosome-associated translation inhibitor RaiA